MTRASMKPPKGDRRPPGRRTLRDLVEDYLRVKDACHDPELAWYRDMPSLDEAIRKAALCETRKGKRHPHQYRVPRAAFPEAARRLARVPLDRAKNFEELLTLVAKACRDVRGFGSLAQYDAAFRVGLYLKKLPRRVYLHAGTRDGAKALGLPHYVPALEMSALPVELRVLEPRQAEDFLCIYKGKLRRGRSA